MEYYDHYVALCKERLKLDGKSFKDPFDKNHGQFMYGQLIERLEKLRKKILEERSIAESSEPKTSS